MSDLAVPIGDDDLVAWVDGRLDGARRDDVSIYLAAHPEIAARLEAEARDRDALRAALRAKFEEPIPARLRVANVAAAQRLRHRARVQALAAAFAAFVIGAGSGWFAARDAAPPAMPPAAVAIAADAANAHRTFVVEVAHPVEVAASERDHLMHWLSKRLGRPLAAPDLSAYGFRLMGGRLLPGGAGAAAQLMYEDAAHRRLTLYVEVAEGGETAFRFARAGADATFAWVDRGFGFAVTAETTREALLPIAETVYRQFGPPVSG